MFCRRKFGRFLLKGYKISTAFDLVAFAKV